jgi:hypothetical protein
MDSDYKDWKDRNHLQFTSDSKQEILDAVLSTFKKISESDILNSRITSKVKKL